MKNNNKLCLPNVTLAAMASVRVKETVKALQYSMRNIEFGEVVFVSHEKPPYLPKGITFKYIDRLNNIDDFNYNMIYKMHEYIETEFMLLVHYDGFVVNADMWQDKFLEYDYIGSPFPIPNDDFTFRDINGNLCRVGNSVSIRSKRLMELPTKINIPFEADHGWFNEDGFICCKNKHIFEAAGMVYAPLDVAKYFGHESMIPEVIGIKPFVFHKWQGQNAVYPKFSNYMIVDFARNIKKAILKIIFRFKGMN